jgi:hypothetical protein
MDASTTVTAECLSCGSKWTDNEWTVTHDFHFHKCLTKAGKPRKARAQGRIRTATKEEFEAHWESLHSSAQ